MRAAGPVIEELLSRSALTAGLSASSREELAGCCEPVDLKEGQVLFRAGSPAAHLWLLGTGAEVSVSAQAADGRPRLVARLAEGNTLGELALLERRDHEGIAVVTGAGPALRLAVEPLLTLQRARRPAALHVLRQLAREVCRKLRATSAQVANPGPPHPAPVAQLVGARCPDELLETVPLLADFPKVVKLALAQRLRLIEVPAVQPLWADGDLADAAYFLAQGRVAVGRSGQTLFEVGPGALLGVVSCIDGGPRMASAVTTGPARLLRLPDPDFDALFEAQNPFACRLVEDAGVELAGQMRAVNARLIGAPQPSRGFLLRSDFLPLEPGDTLPPT